MDDFVLVTFMVTRDGEQGHPMASIVKRVDVDADGVPSAEAMARLSDSIRSQVQDKVRRSPVGHSVRLSELVRIRTDDDAYRVFDPDGVGAGSITYDPVIGGSGTVRVKGNLSRTLDYDLQAYRCWTAMKQGGEDGLFEHLENLYRQLAPAATTP